MIIFCKKIDDSRRMVQRLLCTDQNSYRRDDWTSHFRMDHWQYYFNMVPEQVSKGVPGRFAKSTVRPLEIEQPSDSNIFSAQEWITLADIEEEVPIISDHEIITRLEMATYLEHRAPGPTLVQRFVVVREGDDACLYVIVHS